MRDPIVIDMSMFDAIPDSRLGPKREWTRDEDTALLRYWPVKVQSRVAKALGRGENQCRRRFRELTCG